MTDRDEYNIWQHVATEFTNRLPLRNVLWKATLGVNPPSGLGNSNTVAPSYSSRNGAERTIPKLHLDMQKFTTELCNAGASRLCSGAVNVSGNPPYIHLYFINCDVRFRFLVLRCCAHV
jgi:hypothetical protein